ncbi:MAG: ATP-binding cassette domain-containing protein [Flavobacteriales bacterium]|jgi:ABC-2 type transport system ATP-binding protein
MQIELHHTGKKYQREWIFREVNAQWKSGARIAIVGGNGSGKSTLAQIVSGFLSSSEGEVSWNLHQSNITRDKLYTHVSLCTPLMQLWDDFTLAENFELLSRFKATRGQLTLAEFAAMIGLEHVKHRTLKHYSSGMRQRVKLGLAILADTPLLILDEPCSHLDASAISWYQQLLESHAENRTIIVASNNDTQELFLCTEQIDITSYKPQA